MRTVLLTLRPAQKCTRMLLAMAMLFVAGSSWLAATAGTAGPATALIQAAAGPSGNSPLMETNVLIARGSEWRYNDTGSDLTTTAWKRLDYYDEAWALGRAPFGYGTLVTTTNSFGPDGTNKYPTCYYRKIFKVDVPPTVSLCLNLRRDDGAVVYFNGVEVYCINVTNEPIAYTNWASVSVEGADETNYFHADLPLTNVLVGPNVLAVEVHQVSAQSSDLAFDLELIGISPLVPRRHEVAATKIEPLADAIPGDLLRVAVTVTNLGNVTEESVSVFLQDTNSNQVVATGSLSNLAVGASATLLLDWKTLGYLPGSYTLQAFTVVGGQTNASATVSVPAMLRDAAFGVKTMNLAGSLGGRCNAVTPSGNLLLVGAGATLEVWNRSNPGTPTKVGSVHLAGLVESIAATGAYAFVACGSAGVEFVDLSNPAAPVRRNTFNSSGHAYDVAASGTVLYLADGSSGVRVFDIRTPASPVLLGAFYTVGAARAISLSGNYAYVLDQQQGLVVLDCANPAQLTPRGGYELFDPAEALAVDGNLALLATGSGKLVVLSLTNGLSPALQGSLVLNAVGQALALQGNLAYVAARDSGVLVVDVADPRAPVLRRALPTTDQVTDLALVDQQAYLANGFGGVGVLDLSQPDQPVVAGQLNTGLRGADVAIRNNLAYVAAGEAGLRIFSLTNLSLPVLLGSSPDALNARSLALSGSLACVGDGQYGLKLVDVTDPAQPVLRGSFTHPNLGSIRGIAAEGPQVVLTDGKLILLVDVADPAKPVLRGSYTAPAFAYAVAVANGQAYAACGHYGVLILSMTSGLSFSGRYDTPGAASSIALSGVRAYVADGQAGWLVLDVAKPQVPVLVKASASEGPVNEIARVGALAVLADSLQNVRSLHVASPLVPLAKDTFGPLVRAMRLAAGGQYAMAAEDESGVAIMDLGVAPESDLDQDGLPDAWEQQIVDADPNDSIRAIENVLPEADFDGDGCSNWHEYLAGTVPTDSASLFAVRMQADSAAATINVRWHSAPGKVYTVYISTNLSGGFQVLQDNVPATPPINSFTDTMRSEMTFYIIGIR